ncbi:hypothetical protein OAP74_00795 [bacterium]|nr:hypothetical protein [bacterium]
MIEIHGPTYRYNGEKLTKPEIMFVNDHHYDEEAHCFHIEKLLENSVCDPKLHTLVFDHVLHDDALNKYNCICLPMFLAVEAEEFRKQEITLDWNKKTHLFNFSINKPRIHRQLLLKEIKRLELKNYTYSLPWKTNNINDIPVTDYKFGPEVCLEQGIRNGNFKNGETYKHLLKESVYEPSCISIITEPLYYEREAFATEKSYMAMFGGTFPIWFGGWKIPQSMRDLGFDVFDDIIDHSYETLSDPYERCVNSLLYNQHLFKDIENLKNLLLKNTSRLLHNVELIKDNVFLKECLRQADLHQGPVRTELLKFIPSFRNGTFTVFMEDFNNHKVLGSEAFDTRYDKSMLKQ